MLVEDDVALVVLHDVVAVQPVTVLVEIVLALGAGVLLRRENGVADLVRIRRASLVDRRRENGDGVVGPGALVVRRNLVGVAVHLAEGLRGFTGILGIVGDAVGAEQGRACELRR